MPEVLQLDANGWMPNNPHLPVLLYRHAVPIAGSDPAAAFEAPVRAQPMAAAVAQRRLCLSSLSHYGA